MMWSAIWWTDACGASVRSPGIAITITGTPSSRTNSATSTDTSTTMAAGRVASIHRAMSANLALRAVVVVRHPMQCTVCRLFCGSRIPVVTRESKDRGERMSWDVQRGQCNRGVAKLGADAGGSIEVTGAVVVDVVADHGASHFDRRSSCPTHRIGTLAVRAVCAKSVSSAPYPR